LHAYDRDLFQVSRSHRNLLERTPVENSFPYKLEISVLLDTAYLPALVEEIEKAKNSIDISMYLGQENGLLSREIIVALLKAIKRGVRVRALFEDRIASNRYWASVLTANGAEAYLDADEVKLHDKAVLIDGSLFIVGSHNWTDASLTKNREVSFIVKGEAVAFNIWQKRFDDDIEKAEVCEDKIEFVNIPVHNNFRSHPKIVKEECRGRIVVDADYVKACEDIVKLMRRTFDAAIYYISTTSLTHGRPLFDFFSVLSSKAKESSVRIILDQMDISEAEAGKKDNDIAIQLLKSYGIDASYDPPNVTHHVKTIVVDDRYILSGSHNWTISSTRYNHETSILVDAPITAKLLIKYFDSLNGNQNLQIDTKNRETMPMEKLIKIH